MNFTHYIIISLTMFMFICLFPFIMIYFYIGGA